MTVSRLTALALEAQHAEVGGYIEMLQVGDGLALFFNEEARSRVGVTGSAR